MTHENNLQQNSFLTFKYNKNLKRHGWLRLTPAYSVKIVHDILLKNHTASNILDPFSGTGTTATVAAELGYRASAYDINPFLIWLGNIKCSSFSKKDISEIDLSIKKIITLPINNDTQWIPNIFNIERWWNKDTVNILSNIRSNIVNTIGEVHTSKKCGIIWIAFARLVIETSSAAFNHVSMSFKDNTKILTKNYIIQLFSKILHIIRNSLEDRMLGIGKIQYSNATIPYTTEEKFDLIITSPPYPNRMSYIRELRPYMYWLKFIDTAQSAGELDWEAIGGTWGIATSRLKNWAPQYNSSKKLKTCVSKIAETSQKNSEILSKYIFKYFDDIDIHISNTTSILKKNAHINYILGNSNFFGINVDTEYFLIESLNKHNFSNITSEIIRKRNCKKNLFEYKISAIYQA